MKYLLTGVAAMAMITACGQKDKASKDATPAGVEFSESKIPAFKLRKGDPATAPAALAALSLDTEKAGSISWGNKTLKGDQATFTDVILVSAADAPDETVTELDEDGIPVDAEDDAFDLEGSDLKVSKIVFDGLGVIDGKANFSRMVMSDVKLVPKDPKEDGGSGTIGSIELVNPSPETAAWVGSLFGGEEADMPKGAALAFDHWAMSKLNFTVDEEDGEKGGFTVDTIEISSLHDEKAAQMLLKNMKFDLADPADNTDMTLSLGSVEVRGADLKLLADAGQEAEDPGKVTDRMMNMSRNDPTNPGYDSMKLDGFQMDISGVKFALPKFTSDVGRDKKGRATVVRTQPFKMTLATGEGEMGEKFGSQLATLGYETIEVTGEGYQTYDPDKDIVTYVKGKNYWDLKDGFRLDVSARYSGAKAIAEAAQAQTLDATDPGAAIESAIDKMVIHGVEISFDDNGFVDRAFNAYAAQSGEDPKQLRNQVSGMMAMGPMMAGGMGIDPELASEAAAALSSFIADPKTLTLALAPAEPIALSKLADMEDPSALNKKALGFTASNK